MGETSTKGLRFERGYYLFPTSFLGLQLWQVCPRSALGSFLYEGMKSMAL